MKKNAELIVVRRLHNGIYASEGGGQAKVWSRHVSGPRGLRNAIESHGQERYWAQIGFGNIGSGAGWIEVVPPGGQPGDGISFDFPLDDYYLPHPPVGGAPMDWWQEQLSAVMI